MNFALTIKTEPASEPVTKTELRAQLRSHDTTDDTLLDVLIVAARQAIENACRRSMLPTTYELYLDEFPKVVELLNGPVASVTSVKYLDASAVEQTLDAADYRTDLKSIVARITPAYESSWPTTYGVMNAVTVEYVAGYASAAAVPTALKMAILALAVDLFEHPEASAETKLTDNKTVKHLIDRYVVPFVPYN